VKISNPISLSRSETGFNPEKKAKNGDLLELNVRKPLAVSLSQSSEKLRLYNLLLNLTISV
jgi:hypothetical protein